MIPKCLLFSPGSSAIRGTKFTLQFEINKNAQENPLQKWSLRYRMSEDSDTWVKNSMTVVCIGMC